MRIGATLLALVAIALVVSLLRDGGELPRGTAGGRAQVPAAATTTAGVESRVEREAAAEADPAARGEADGRIVLRGRCVDAHGAALAGVQATLTARSVPQHRDEEQPTFAPRTTAADGVFAFRLAPRRTSRFQLVLGSGGRVPVHGYWPGLTDDTDLGDVTVAIGCVVHGVVVDSRGVPQSGVGITVSAGEATTSVYPEAYQSTTAAADGGFRLPRTFPGAKQLRLRGALLRSPAALVVPRDVREHFVEIVVESVEDRPSIRGLVVDDRGAPIEGVALFSNPSARGFRIADTGADGRFTIMTSDPAPTEPLLLQARKLGFADIDTETAYPWGATDVRLTMARLEGVELTVTDGEQPIEDYSVWITEVPGLRANRRLDYDRIRNPGPHDEGRTEVADLQSGEFLLRVLPDDPSLLESDPIPVRIGPTSTSRRVVLDRAVEQDVVVRQVGGPPIPDAKVELLETFDDIVVTAKTPTFRRGDRASERYAYERQVVRTGERGEARLRGPPRGTLWLRVTGSGFPAQIHDDVHLVAGADPIVIEVAAGATIVGRIRPAQLMQQLFAMVPRRASMQSAILLRRRGETVRFAARLDESGGFEVDAVPAGSWDASLQFVRYVEDPGGGSSLHGLELDLDPIRDLASGERRELDLDLSHLVFGSLEFEVYLDEVRVQVHHVSLESDDHRIALFADGEGRIEGLVPPGQYVVRLNRDDGTLEADREIVVHPGEELTQNVHFRTR